MPRVPCHCCREHGGITYAEYLRPDGTEPGLIEARHWNGIYFWGEGDPRPWINGGRGRKVLICEDCRWALETPRKVYYG